MPHKCGQRYGHGTDLASAVPYRGQNLLYGLRPYCYSRIRNGTVHIPSTQALMQPYKVGT